jgi:transglutaminase-like putative cysteine protease
VKGVPPYVVACARAAGCVVRAHVGGASLGNAVLSAADVIAPDAAATVRFLRALATHDAKIADVQALAGAFRRAYPEATDWELTERVMRWVQAAVPYVRERGERFQSAAYTRRKGGDCDDHARLVVALLKALGIRARVGVLPEDGEPRHAAAEAHLAGAWRWVETTIPAYLGEHPFDAVRRLGLGQQRKDIAA